MHIVSSIRSRFSEHRYWEGKIQPQNYVLRELTMLSHATILLIGQVHINKGWICWTNIVSDLANLHPKDRETLMGKWDDLHIVICRSVTHCEPSSKKQKNGKCLPIDICEFPLEAWALLQYGRQSHSDVEYSMPGCIAGNVNSPMTIGLYMKLKQRPSGSGLGLSERTWLRWSALGAWSE
jgi:hypothetical protein